MSQRSERPIQKARTRTRTWFRVHSFTGVITGLLLFVICWSGTFAVIANEIDWLITPALRVEPQDHRANWAEIQAAAEAASPGTTVNSISAPLYHRSAAIVRMTRTGGGDGTWVFVDPYTAEVTGIANGMTVQRFFRDFHRRLFFPNPWGIYVVSLFSVSMLMSLVAALYFYKRWWRRFFQFKAGGGRSLWSQLHKIVGLWSIWFVIVIGLTGVWYLFENARTHLGDGKDAYAGEPSYAIRAVPRPTSARGLPTLPLSTLLEQVRQRRGDIDIQTIRQGRDGRLYVDGQAGHLLVRDRANQLYLDVRTGDVLYDQRASDLPLYWRWSDTADPLHFGDFGGLVSKLIWFVFGLALSGLILTGTYLHARRLARDVGSRHTRMPGVLAACFVSIMVLAGSVPFGLDLARSYGPVVDNIRRLPTVAPGIQLVIFVWVITTLAIIAAWVFMLWRPQVVVPARVPSGAGQTK